MKYSLLAQAPTASEYPFLEWASSFLGLAVPLLILIALLVEAWHRWKIRRESVDPHTRILGRWTLAVLILDCFFAFASWRVNAVLDGEQERRLIAAERAITPRRLTETQIAGLRAILGTIPIENQIRVVFPVSDPEALDFANQYVAVFKESGWTAKSGGVMSPGEVARGAAILYDPTVVNAKHVSALVDALRSVGCDVGIEEVDMEDKKDPVQLWIYPK